MENPKHQFSMRNVITAPSHLDALPDVSALFVVVLVSEALPPVAKVGGDHEDVRRVGHVPREDATVLDLQL